MKYPVKTHAGRTGAPGTLLSAVAVAVVILVAACGGSETGETGGGAEPPPVATAVARIATYNIEELSTERLAAVDADGVGVDERTAAAAYVIQRVRPAVLVVQEIDLDLEGSPDDLVANARRFVDNYLTHGENPIDYPYLYAAPTNTGILSGHDLGGDGKVATEADEGTREYGEDCLGFGRYPGQYSMAILSQFPIDEAGVRTFRNFKWKDLPGNHQPAGFYSPEALEILPLSSKSHWDVPVRLGKTTLHLWVSHPTPPAFDGEEDRNGRRNFDEIGFWVRYLDGEASLYDDAGGTGGYRGEDPFILAGDLNADPDNAENAVYEGKPAIAQLLGHPRVRDTGSQCTSGGSLLLTSAEPGPPDFHEQDTAVFQGGMRADYLLPVVDLQVTGGGVFWPRFESDPEGDRYAELASDHRLVYIDVVYEVE